MKLFPIAVAGVLAGLLWPSQQAPAVPLVADCTTTGAKSVTTTTPISTASGALVRVARIVFTQRAGDEGCVLIQFSADASADAGTDLVIHAKLDGVDCEPPAFNFVPLSARPQPSATRSGHFVCFNVTPGRHEATLHYRSSGPPSAVHLGFRITTVHYRQ